MKQGRSLPDLAAELQRRKDAKQDILVDSRAITVSGDGKQLIVGNRGYDLTNLAHRQLAEFAGIPQKYYDRMLVDAPMLLCANIVEWLQREQSRRMVRTLDGKARAFLSDKYRRLDNEDVADAALKALLQRNLAQVESCEVTETRLYIKALFPGVTREVKVGDVVQAGVMITNSEVGLGALSVRVFLMRLSCINGMVRESVSRQSHVGRQVTADDAGIAFRDETVAADDRALMLKLEDTIAAVAGEPFERSIAALREAAGSEPIVKPIAAMEVLAKSVGLNLTQKDSILERLIKGGDYTKWGVANAITNLANTTEDYDDATALEEMGSRIIDLAPSDWRQAVQAA